MITSYTYEKDTKRNLNFVVPLLYIEKNEEKMGIGLQQLNFTDLGGNPLYYEPLLLSMPSIKEKINTETKKYSINSLNLNLSNVKNNGKVISDRYNFLINANIKVFYKTQNANTLEACLQVYEGKILRVTHNEKVLKLFVEDSSQIKVQKNVPKNRLGDDGTIVPKYRNKPIPFVYGMVNKSPCVVRGRDIICESQDISGIIGKQKNPVFFNIDEHALFIHDGGEIYGNVLSNINTVIEGSFDVEDEDGEFSNPYKIQTQWYEKQDVNGYKTIIKLYNTELLKRNGLQIRVFAKPSEPELIRYTENLINEDALDLEDGQEVNLLDSESIYTDTIEPIKNLTDNDYNSKVLILDHPVYEVDGSGYDIDWNQQNTSEFLYYELRLSPLKYNNIDFLVNLRVGINGYPMPTLITPITENHGFSMAELVAHRIDTENIDSYEDEDGNIYDYSKLFIFDEAGIDSSEEYLGDDDFLGEEGLDEFSVDIAFKDQASQDGTAGVVFTKKTKKEESCSAIFLAGELGGGSLSSGYYQADLVARFREFDTTYLSDCKDPLTSDYYINVMGRKETENQGVFPKRLLENFTFNVKKEWIAGSDPLTLNNNNIESFDFKSRLEGNIRGYYNNNNGVEYIETKVGVDDNDDTVTVKLYPYNMTILENNDDNYKIIMNCSLEKIVGLDGGYSNFFKRDVEIKFNTGEILNAINANYTNENNYDFLFADDGQFHHNFGQARAGRIAPNENIATIIKDILIQECNSELNQFNNNSLEESQNFHTSWRYAFAQKDEIPAKKIIEGLAQSSQSFARFRGSDNTFIFNTIKDEYVDEDVNFIIENNDVLNYSFSRTKTEDIKTNINVLFEKDYASDSYLSRTLFKNVNELMYVEGSYDYNYYDIDENNEDTTLEFKSDYIRDKNTAIKLRDRLLSWYMNSHNIMILELPLKYAILEVGDMVAFDKEVNNLKLFGEPYTRNYQNLGQGFLEDANLTYRNGQEIYPYFIITETNKKVDKIQLKLIQLHKHDVSLFNTSNNDDEEETEETIEFTPGDVDNNNAIDVLDVIFIINIILSGGTAPNQQQFLSADIDGNGIVDVLDVIIIIQIILED